MDLNNKVARFNARVPLPARLLLVLLLALSFAFFVYPRLVTTGWAVAVKLQGRARDCPWSRVFRYYEDLRSQAEYGIRSQASLYVEEKDEQNRLLRVHLHFRSFWVPTREDSAILPAFLWANHELLTHDRSAVVVRRGDIVLDCGAHIGTFVHRALEMGATTVVAIEPDPDNVLCLKRNFPKEIAAGRVVVVTTGVWDHNGQITLHSNPFSSATSTTVQAVPGNKIEVPVRTIDSLVTELKLTRVDFIKMDIEGAERKALAGARDTLRRFRPRIMLDINHLPEDRVVLPDLIRQSHSDYLMTCGPCDRGESPSGVLAPGAVFFQ